MATPTLVQHRGGGASDNGTGVNAGQYFLLNPSLAGNCLVLCLSWTDADGSLTSITDDGGNAWSTTAAVSVVSASGVRSAIFVAANCNANTKSVTVNYTAIVGNFTMQVSEFCNVASSTPLNGTTSAIDVAAPNLAAGSFTPTSNNDANGGNLIFAYFRCSLAAGNSGAADHYTPGGSFTLLDGDRAGSLFFTQHANEYFVQATQAAINPGLTANSQAAADKYNCLAIALKAASAGTAYNSANGIHLRKMLHYTNVYPVTGTTKLVAPSEGNLRVVTISFPPTLGVTGVTDSDGKTYTQIAAPVSSAFMFYAENCTANNALIVTITTSGGSGSISSSHFLDIEFAAATSSLGAHNDNSVTSSVNLRVDDCPTITPTQANSLIIAAGINLHGPSLNTFDPAATNLTPAAAIFDLINYTGETDGDPIDNADIHAHYYNPNTDIIHWNWVNGAASSTSVIAAEFKAAPVTPVDPGNPIMPQILM